MDRQTFLKWLFPVLVIVTFFVWGNVFLGGGRKKPAATRTSHSRQFVHDADFQKLVNEHLGANQGPESPAKNPGWGRDPFFLDGPKASDESELVTVAATPVPDLHLDAVLVDRSGPVAVINGEEAGVNGKIGAFTVTEISEEKVRLNDGHRTIELFR